MKHPEYHSIPVFILVLILSQFPASQYLNSQFISQKKLQKLNNDISSRDVGVKYIYSFPVEKTDVRRAENGQQLEMPDYENEALIAPVMEMVLNGRIVVYDPNFWGDVHELTGNKPILKIDTTQILKYLGAGTDTAMLLDESGNITLIPTYNKPDINEISGIFFMENWLVNLEEQLFHKEILAYLPIRDYYVLNRDELNMEKQRRLIFMVSPGRSINEDGNKVNKSKYILVNDDISYEIGLYNKPYSDYLYRNEQQSGIDQEEYEEWEYHHFDFYKFFNRKLFLDVLLAAILDGKLPAYKADQDSLLLSPDQIEELESVKHDEINSIIFYEDWYLDQGSLAMEKVVNRLVLVRHIRDYDDYTKEYIRTRKVPLLMIRFRPNL